MIDQHVRRRRRKRRRKRRKRRGGGGGGGGGGNSGTGARSLAAVSASQSCFDGFLPYK